MLNYVKTVDNPKNIRIFTTVIYSNQIIMDTSETVWYITCRNKNKRKPYKANTVPLLFSDKGKALYYISKKLLHSFHEPIQAPLSDFKGVYPYYCIDGIIHN